MFFIKPKDFLIIEKGELLIIISYMQYFYGAVYAKISFKYKEER